MAVLSNFRRSWNAFWELGNTPPEAGYGPAQGFTVYSDGGRSPDRVRRRVTNERSIIASIYSRISIDVAAIPIRHVKLDENDRYLEDLDSELNMCLTYETNVDQGPRAFRQDIVMSLFDRGVVAIVPVDTSARPNVTDDYDILSIRVGEIVKWFPQHVRVKLYNEKTGVHQEVTLDKSTVAIVENPLYNVMNEPNSTLQRLLRKLNLLDVVDEQSSSGKLDMIIQLPYVIKSETRRQQAEQRRQDIEMQLRNSQYGIAYTDGTERITQLNRPAENNLFKQVEYLVELLYSELGITKSVMDGTADEATMLNYYNRTVEPILEAIVEGMQRAFLKRGRFKNQERIHYAKDPFKLVPIAQIAEIADKFTRNEILSSNEMRSFMKIKPSDDPKADKLQNSNMPQPSDDGGLDMKEENQP